MKRLSFLILFALLLKQPAFSQNKIWNETEDQKTKRLEWWTDARFGMFIHWGLYV